MAGVRGQAEWNRRFFGRETAASFIYGAQLPSLWKSVAMQRIPSFHAFGFTPPYPNRLPRLIILCTLSIPLFQSFSVFSFFIGVPLVGHDTLSRYTICSDNDLRRNYASSLYVCLLYISLQVLYVYLRSCEYCVCTYVCTYACIYVCMYALRVCTCTDVHVLLYLGLYMFVMSICKQHLGRAYFNV